MNTTFRVCRNLWRTPRLLAVRLGACMEGTGSGLAHGPFTATPAPPGHAARVAQPCCIAPFTSVGSARADSGSGTVLDLCPTVHPHT